MLCTKQDICIVKICQMNMAFFQLHGFHSLV